MPILEIPLTKTKRKNKTFKKKATSYQKKIRNNRIAIIGMLFFLSVIVISGYGEDTGRYINSLSTYNLNIVHVPTPEKPLEIIDVTSGTVREVTAYNLGDVNQTDSSPCITANGMDGCKMLEQGINICAANFVPLGTTIYVQHYGECLVIDRMNSRFPNRVDIGMKLSEKQRAIKFGLQNLLVKI